MGEHSLLLSLERGQQHVQSHTVTGDLEDLPGWFLNQFKGWLFKQQEIFIHVGSLVGCAPKCQCLITQILFSAPSQASENKNILKKVCRKVVS